MASSNGSSGQHAAQRPLRRWAGFAAHHPWQVVGAWVVILAILATLATTMGGTFADKFSVPGTESQQALDTLKERFPALSGDTAQVVFKSDTNITTDPAVQAKITEFVDKAKQLPEVVGVASPLDPTTPTISRDGTIAYATIQYPKPGVELQDGTVDALLDLVKATNSQGLQVEVGGQVVFSVPETGPSEIVGIVAAIVILLITFGSVVAMGLPIVTAGVGVGIAVLITTVLAAFLDFSTITTALISMMGLGVGIDYALFIISRFREERAGGRSLEEAIVTAIDTAGRAVLFAGTVVVIALLGLFSVGIPFIGFLGLGGAIAVATSMTIAVGLMPALLRLLGRFMDRWTIFPNKHRPAEDTFGYKLTARIQKAPLAWLLAALVLLGALGWSAIFDVHLGSSDAGTNPAGTTTRKAYDLIAQGFGPGANGPLLVVVENGNGSALDQAQLAALDTALTGTSGVAFASQPIPNQQGDTAVIQVVPLTAPQDKATEDLINRLRDQVIPQATQGTDLQVYIGGSTATFADLASATSARLPLYIAIVAGLSILILMAVFRSVLIPIKAAIANLLSFFAGYGVMVLVFQKGVFGINDWLGVDRTGPIESFLPIFLFGILFGLSMDYEIFLISRVHEAWSHRKDNAWALRHGIGSSGRVVLAAGAIMTSVFLAFTLGDSRIIKEMGLGLGAAILIDVLVVRMIVVPSFMSLMGTANWWLPGWLDRILPRLDVEGEAAPGEFDDDDDPATPSTPAAVPAI
ncbi:MAG TPA: MMPL family transporter [Thermomicrobiales bacterium]|nr:MMPL family transporter [Thermomicrobiales bacterium]